MRSCSQLLYGLIIVLSHHLSNPPPLYTSNLAAHLMSLSKPCLEKVEKIDQEYEKYDFDNQWDDCDYTDPASLAEKVETNDLLIIQWNTRGLRGKIHNIEGFLNNTLEQKVGVVMINKSWLTKNGPPLPKIMVTDMWGIPGRIEEEEE